MNCHLSTYLQNNRPRDDAAERIHALSPFRWVLVLWVALVYYWTVVLLGPLDFSPRQIGLTILLVAHAIGHWASLSLISRPWALRAYFAGQAVLVALIGAILLSPLATFCLYLALTGATVLFLDQKRVVLLEVMGYVVLAIATFWVWLGVSNLAVDPQRELQRILTYLLPLMLFVVGGAVLFLRELNGRERTQRLLGEIETAHDQLATYVTRVEELTLANERQRLARELHDTLAQGLAGVILQLEAGDSHLARGNVERGRAIVQQASSRARETLAEARETISALRAEPAATTDLVAAAREEVARFEATAGIPGHISVGALPRLPASAAGTALRALREGLANVARHARAANVWVSVQQDGPELRVEVRDDGIGFDPSAEPAGHYGLLGLRERARLSCGKLEIASTPGAGTTLCLRLPLSAEAGSVRG